MEVKLYYDKGTIVLASKDHIPLQLTKFFKFDPRINAYRSLAMHYPVIVSILRDLKISFMDNVFHPISCLKFNKRLDVKLRNYQREALNNWMNANKRGIIVLPTGSGKTLIGIMAILELKEPTLVIAPTIELMDQWALLIQKYLNTDVGLYGGGDKELKCITIATYSSAYLNAELIGNKFKLMIFDEVHHLPSEGYRQIAELSAAPHRMGLTATPEREDEAHKDLDQLVGPIVYRSGVKDFAGSYLANFEIKKIYVPLTREEYTEYKRLSSIYEEYFKKRGWTLRSLKDFEKFIMRTGNDIKAREALLAWNRARSIALNSSTKIEKLRELLRYHRGERIIIFTEHNEIVKRISNELLIPIITHKTSDYERKAVMDGFRTGIFNAIATSKVLEEGIDVPDANIAIILSGSGSKREFIQRLGRILRPKEGKKAILYEIISSGTKEVRVSKKRSKALGE
ncbi:MAG: DEAD/DEAH box helicase family protein [Thermoprotei archaeon]|jgi:superfamily II DNA or RNA helicase